MKKMKVKFREVKNRCRKIVESYRTSSHDARSFPEFDIGCLASDASRGYVQLIWNENLSDAIAYNSIAELTLIIESLGKAWEATK